MNKLWNIRLTKKQFAVFLAVVALAIGIGVIVYTQLKYHAEHGTLKNIVGLIESTSAKNFANYYESSGTSGLSIDPTMECQSIVNILLHNTLGLPPGYYTDGIIKAEAGQRYGTCLITQTSSGNDQLATILLTEILVPEDEEKSSPD